MGIAELHESAAFISNVGIYSAAQVMVVVGDDSNRATFDPTQGGHTTRPPTFADFQG